MITAPPLNKTIARDGIMRNMDNLYENLFQTTYFDNKNIYMIANNKKIGNIAQINKLQLNSDSIVIRFGGDKYNLEEKIIKNRTDIMVYRSNKTHFNNCNKYNKKGKIKLFIWWDNARQPDNKRYIDKNSYAKSFINQMNYFDQKHVKVGFISSKYNKDGTKSPTQGFGVLINLIEKTKYKKIVLIGFTNLTRDNIKINKKFGCHYIYYENQYFKNVILKKYKNIHTMG